FAPTLAATVALVSCAPDIGELDELPPANSVVVAQFDPTNEISQLQLIPTPTVLAQNPDGTINKDAVRPEPCELPTTTQCLEFVDGGWPVNLFPTLFFSAPLVMDTLQQGLKLYEVGAAGLTEVEVNIVQIPRPAPAAACNITQDQVNAAWGPEAVDVILQPTSGLLKEATQYIVVATRALQGAPLEGSAGTRVVEPSALFFTLNVDEAPVTMDGTILDPLLRSNVQGVVLASLFPGRAIEDLNESELQMFQAGVTASGVDLFGLYQFVNGSVTAVAGEQRPIANRSDIVMINTWTTSAPVRTPTEVAFDPLGTDLAAGDVRFPLPNDQLLTREVDPTVVPGGLQVAFPTAGIPDNLTAAIGLLNTLNGFGTTTPILMQVTRTLDQASLAGNVIMVELDANGAPTGNQPTIQVVATASTATDPAQLVIQPVIPLKPNTKYAVGVTTGVLDSSGEPIAANSTYDFLKVPDPLIDGAGTVNSSVVQALECSTLETTGMLAGTSTVQALATTLEVDLARPRWQEAFQALEGLSPAVPRTELAMAFTYKTQSITDTVDLVKTQLLPQYEMLPPMDGRLLPTNIDLVNGETNAIAAAFQITDPVLQIAYTSNLGRARQYLMRYYRLTSGNPFTTGTFTPETLMMPSVEYYPIWVFTPAGAPPPGGWKVAIFQHGLGGSKDNAAFIANTLAQSGWATVSMDLPFHGLRASDIADNATGIPCTNIDPAMVMCDFETGVCTNGCDGLRDSSGTGLVNPNPGGARGTGRQIVVDLLTFLRTIDMESGMGQPLEDLNPANVGFVGQSLGGISGGGLVAFTSPMDLDAAVLNVAGGNTISITTNSVPTISGGFFAALAATGVCTLNNPLQPALGCQDTALYRLFLLL
ncbi:MAG: Ig-like domain-containing protein, partial [Myxococcota bacterium]